MGERQVVEASRLTNAMDTLSRTDGSVNGDARDIERRNFSIAMEQCLHSERKAMTLIIERLQEAMRNFSHAREALRRHAESITRND